MLRPLHPYAGVTALLTIATFWLCTIAADFFGSTADIVTVKSSIPWGFVVLIPALMLTGASGLRAAGRASSPLILRKKRRMPLIAANGIVVLVPCAFYLRHLALAGEFGTSFVIVQSLELIFGATNIFLLTQSLMDGLRLKGRLRSSRPLG